MDNYPPTDLTLKSIWLVSMCLALINFHCNIIQPHSLVLRQNIKQDAKDPGSAT